MDLEQRSGGIPGTGHRASTGAPGIFQPPLTSGGGSSAIIERHLPGAWPTVAKSAETFHTCPTNYSTVRALKGRPGPRRIPHATRYSRAGLKAAFLGEAAFRRLLPLIPASFLLDVPRAERAKGMGNAAQFMALTGGTPVWASILLRNPPEPYNHHG